MPLSFKHQLTVGKFVKLDIGMWDDTTRTYPTVFEGVKAQVVESDFPEKLRYKVLDCDRLMIPSVLNDIETEDPETYPTYTAKYRSTVKEEQLDQTVNHPAHYNTGKIEVIEFIEDQKLSYHLGNAVKYISRAGKKDPAKTVEDLKKAQWYIRRQIEILSDTPARPNDMKD